jgi:hypothetical protein
MGSPGAERGHGGVDAQAVYSRYASRGDEAHGDGGEDIQPGSLGRGEAGHECARAYRCGGRDKGWQSAVEQESSKTRQGSPR